MHMLLHIQVWEDHSIKLPTILERKIVSDTFKNKGGFSEGWKKINLNCLSYILQQCNFNKNERFTWNNLIKNIWITPNRKTRMIKLKTF